MALEVTQTEQTQAATATHIISVRKVADELYRALKVGAATKGMTFQAYCISIFEAHIRQQAQNGGLIFTGTALIPASPAPQSQEANTPQPA